MVTFIGIVRLFYYYASGLRSGAGYTNLSIVTYGHGQGALAILIGARGSRLSQLYLFNGGQDIGFRGYGN